MTCREKLKLEHPEQIDDAQLGGCGGCPQEYGYLKKPDRSQCIFGNLDMSHAEKYAMCTRCWDREIPGEDAEKTDSDYDLSAACEDLVKARAVLVTGGFSSTEAFRIIDILLHFGG